MLVKRTLIANSVFFFKTLSKSIYTSNTIKGGGQGGLKRKQFYACPRYLQDWSRSEKNWNRYHDDNISSC